MTHVPCHSGIGIISEHAAPQSVGCWSADQVTKHVIIRLIHGGRGSGFGLKATAIRWEERGREK